MESFEIDLRNEEMRQNEYDLKFECALQAIADDCETELDIIAGSLIHYSELYDIELSVLREALVRELL